MSSTELTNDAVSQHLAKLNENDMLRVLNKAQSISWVRDFHDPVESSQKCSPQVKEFLKERISFPSEGTLTLMYDTEGTVPPATFSDSSESIHYSSSSTFKQKICYDIKACYLSDSATVDQISANSESSLHRGFSIMKSLVLTVINWGMMTKYGTGLSGVNHNSLDIRYEPLAAMETGTRKKRATATAAQYADSAITETLIQHGGVKALMEEVAHEIDVTDLPVMDFLELLVGKTVWERLNGKRGEIYVDSKYKTFTAIIAEKIDYEDDY